MARISLYYFTAVKLSTMMYDDGKALALGGTLGERIASAVKDIVPSDDDGYDHGAFTHHHAIWGLS